MNVLYTSPHFTLPGPCFKIPPNATTNPIVSKAKIIQNNQTMQRVSVSTNSTKIQNNPIWAANIEVSILSSPGVKKSET